MRTPTVPLLAIALVGWAVGAVAAPGDLDPTFNGTGIVVTPITSPAQAAAVVRQTDGKLVAAGYAKVPVMGNPDNLDFALVRYDTSGAPDSSFGGTGTVLTAIRDGEDTAEAVIQQTDGKLVAAGVSYDAGSTNSTVTLVRYLDDGSLDPAFGGGTGKVTTDPNPNFEVALALIQQTDLKLVVAGWSDTDLLLYRFEADGSPDATFNGTGRVTTPIGVSSQALALLQEAGDGKLVVAGSSDTAVLIARYDTNGAPDSLFGGTGVVTTSVGSGNAEARALVQQASDGKLVVAGVSSNGSNTDLMLVRYGLDGVVDSTFGAFGIVTTAVGSGDDAGFALAQQDDGQLVAAGSSNNGTDLDFALARYDLTGTPDGTFGTGGIVTTPIGTGKDEAKALVIQPNGGIVAAGYSTSGSGTSFALARYLSLSGTTTSTTSTTSTSSTTSSTSSTTSTSIPTTTSTSVPTTTSTSSPTSSSTTTTQVATTTVPVGSTTSTTLAALVPGGPARKTKDDCYLELRVGGLPAGSPSVQKHQVVVCADGDPCDQGPCGDGACDIQVAACASQSDPALPDCKPPTSLETVKIIGALDASTGQLLAGPACTPPSQVHVAIKLSRAGKYLARKSKVAIKGNARAPKGVSPRKDRDKWTLQCMPRSGACPG